MNKTYPVTFISIFHPNGLSIHPLLPLNFQVFRFKTHLSYVNVVNIRLQIKEIYMYQS